MPAFFVEQYVSKIRHATDRVAERVISLPQSID